MEKLSSSQKKIIIQAGIFILALSLAWFFLYSPSRKNLNEAKQDFSAVEQEIQEIESLVDGSVPIAESLSMLKEKYQELDSKFPDKEEETLRMLSDFAQKMNIDIVSIKPQRKRTVWRKEEEEAVQVDGKICQCVTVSIDVRCFYQDLVKYIEMLKKDLPAFMVVESVRLLKDKTRVKESKLTRDKLNVILIVGLYLLS